MFQFLFAWIIWNIQCIVILAWARSIYLFFTELKCLCCGSACGTIKSPGHWSWRRHHLRGGDCRSPAGCLQQTAAERWEMTKVLLAPPTKYRDVFTFVFLCCQYTSEICLCICGMVWGWPTESSIFIDLLDLFSNLTINYMNNANIRSCFSTNV